MLSFMNDMLDHWAGDPEDEKLRKCAEALYPFYETHDTFVGGCLNKRVDFLTHKPFFPHEVDRLKEWMKQRPQLTDREMTEGYNKACQQALEDETKEAD